MSKEYVVELARDSAASAPGVGAVGYSLFGNISLSDVVQGALLVAVTIQIGYYTWKWVNEWRIAKEERRVRAEQDRCGCSGRDDADVS